MKSMRSSIYARKDPYLTMLWLGIIGSILVFFFLSITYIALKKSPEWINFNLPVIFWVSTGAILLSSGTLHIANRSFKKEHFSTYRSMLGITFALGLTFTASQILGWYELQKAGVFIKGNLSGAYIYIFSGLHLAHILGGIAVLLYAFRDAVRSSSYIDSYIQSLNPIKRARLKLISVYWHFVDILWIYLFVFFLCHHW
jgi:cytochrome c oxidase subunit 3